jgi:opacity protein-like surface antigen
MCNAASRRFGPSRLTREAGGDTPKQLSSVVQFQGVSAMRSKILVVLIAVAVMGVSSVAMAKGAGGGGMGVHGHGHGHMGHHHHFRNNPFPFGDWGWDWGLGGYGDSGYGSTTVVVSPPPVSRFPSADVTGSVATTPCHFNEDTYNVPTSNGGTRPVQVVSCR